MDALGAGLPWLLLLAASWLLAGVALVRGWLGLEDGVEVAALSLPVGLVVQLLLTNGLAHWMSLPLAAALALGGTLLPALGWWWGRGHRDALSWDLHRTRRAALLALALAVFAGALALGSSEVFPDDQGHASLARLLLSQGLPLRFPCNPELRLAYHYGGAVLVAQLMALGDLTPWAAIDVARACVATGALLLAFLAGWRVRRCAGTGLLSAFLLLTVGQMTWLGQLVLRGGVASWALAQAALPAQRLQAVSGAPFGLLSPGPAPAFAHAHRSLAWGFGAFAILLFLGLAEARATRARKTIPLGVVVGATALVQSGALLILAPALAVWGARALWRRLRATRAVPARTLDGGFAVSGVVALGLTLAVAQGGVVTDALLDRRDGLVNAATTFVFAPLQWPTCRGGPSSSACVALSLLYLGLAPLLLPWLVRYVWREGPPERGPVLAGCVIGGAFPWLVRYPFDDSSVTRVLAFAIWTAGVFLGPWLVSAWRRGGTPRLLAGAAVVALGYSGVGFLLGYAGAVPAADPTIGWAAQTLRLGAHDAALERLAERVPRDALVLDPTACPGGLGSRPAVVLGRYAASAAARTISPIPPRGYVEGIDDPAPEGLRRHGYTHVYVDATWYASLAPAARAHLSGPGFERLGFSGDARDFRALLRVCAPDQRCPGGPLLPAAPVGAPR